MCGICGIVHFDHQAANGAVIQQMMRTLKHRGPDDEGIFLENNVGLGFVRLSIIDLTVAGHQPMFSKDNRYVIVFNGEIFNYIELREELIELGYLFNTNTDTEVLLTAYIVWGEDCLNRLNGMWSFVIFDRIEKTFFASRDRFGIKPFYYILNDEYFAFASEILPLLLLLKDKPNPDYQSIFDFLTFNRTDQTEHTFFAEIKKLQHGFNLKINKIVSLEERNIKFKRWYNLRQQVSIANGFSSHEEFRKLFNSSIGLRLRSDVPVGVCLSGGLDSSSIVSVLLNEFNKKDLNTFSAIYNKGQMGDETEYIKEYQSQVKNMYFTTPTAKTLLSDISNFVKAHAEPIPSTSPYAQFKVMELAKDKVVVLLDGQGADEELAGYHYFFGFYFKDLLSRLKFRKLISEIFFYSIKHKSLMGVKSFVFFLLPDRLKTSTRIKEKAYLNKKFINSYGNSNNIADNLYGAKTLKDALFNHFEYKLEHLLKWEDLNSMWFSLEARVPFLDYRLVEKILATSDDLIIQQGMTKYILRESMKGLVPEKIRLRRDKVGFETPQGEWFKTTEWKKLVNEILNSSSFKNRGLIDSDKALSQYKKHLAGKVSIPNEIWKWVHLELWFREYIDKPVPNYE